MEGVPKTCNGITDSSTCNTLPLLRHRHSPFSLGAISLALERNKRRYQRLAYDYRRHQCRMGVVTYPQHPDSAETPLPPCQRRRQEQNNGATKNNATPNGRGVHELPDCRCRDRLAALTLSLGRNNRKFCRLNQHTTCTISYIATSQPLLKRELHYHIDLYRTGNFDLWYNKLVDYQVDIWYNKRCGYLANNLI